MNIVLTLLNNTNIADVVKCDGEFVIDGELILRVENNQIYYTAVPRPPTKHRYPPQAFNYPSFINHPNKAIYLAYVDGRIAGRIVLHKNWNNYAYLDDIVVDINFRRLGLGRALIAQAKQWARDNRLPGLMLETQNNNLQACRFYESCGFKIGGFDNHLYKAANPDTDEVAIFWYYIFGGMG